MAQDLGKIIQEADKLMKQGRYAEAWKLLLPHKDDENVRKRLKWLKAKQAESKQAFDAATAPAKMKGQNWFSKLGWRMKAGLGFVILCMACTLFSMFGQWVGFIPDATERAETLVAQAEITGQFLTANAPTATNTATTTETSTDNPTATSSSTSSPAPSATASPSPTITPTASSTFTASPSPTITNTSLPSATNTNVPPTATYALYNVSSLCPIGEIETRLLEILANTEGVDFVESLCIQTFNDGSIWFSADIIVYPNYNILAIPRALDEAVVEMLGRSDFETFINMSDGVHAIAYTRNERYPNWDIVVYGDGVIPQTPRPRFGQSDNAQSQRIVIPTNTAISPPIPSSLPSGQTYYANNGDVRVRSCARRDCNQLTVLQTGDSIQVVGETTGDTAFNSNRWYEVNWNGQIGYVHSQLLSSQAPIPTSPPVSSGSVQNPPPVSQQWNCSGDIYNCGDLTCSQISSYMNACPNDPSDLDGNDDGRACESKCG